MTEIGQDKYYRNRDYRDRTGYILQDQRLQRYGRIYNAVTEIADKGQGINSRNRD